MSGLMITRMAATIIKFVVSAGLAGLRELYLLIIFPTKFDTRLKLELRLTENN